MAFIDRVLQEPSYGWKDSAGNLILPSKKQLFSEAISRVNVFRTRKNWMSVISWLVAVCMLPFFLFFVFRYFSIGLLICSVVYGMMVMSTHGTIWFHRFCTHRSYSLAIRFGKLLHSIS